MKSHKPLKSTNVRFRLRALRAALRLSERVSHRLTARALEHLFLRVRRFPVPERERDWVASAKPLVFESRGQRLAAWQWGEGERSVLLAHGWEGRGSQLGGFAAGFVEAGYRVIAFDGPGHGRSARSNGRYRSSIIELAYALRDAEGAFGRFDAVVAHSGGGAATLVAIHEGLQIEKAVLVATASDLASFFFKIVDKLALSEAVGTRARLRMEERYGVTWDFLDRCAFEPSIAPSETPSLLLVHDVDDREVPFASSERVRAGWPTSRLHATRGLGHRRILRDPEVIAEAVRFVGAPAGARSRGAREPLGSFLPA